MTLREALTKLSEGSKRAKTLEIAATQIATTTSRRGAIWAIAASDKERQAAELIATSNMATTLLLVLDDAALDKVLDKDQQGLLFEQNPELAFA